MRITLHTLAVLLGVLLAVAPVLAERPEDERVCGGTPDGKIKWCITLKAPNVCGGPDEGWHCDEVGQCWCGPENALTWPGDDGVQLAWRPLGDERPLILTVGRQDGRARGAPPVRDREATCDGHLRHAERVDGELPDFPPNVRPAAAALEVIDLPVSADHERGDLLM